MLRKLNDGTIIDVDDDALNPDGTLRDGGRLRVPLMFRDSNREIARRRSTPTLRFADGRTDVPVGSRPGFVIDAGGGQEIRDRAYRESVEALQTAWRGEATDATPRPLDAPMSAADAVRTDLPTLIARLNDARRSAYETYVQELTNAWRGPT
jgi:hypothetical protein